MRRRLVLSTVAVALVAVVLLGVPLGFAGAIVRLDIAQQSVQGRADSIGRSADEALSEGRQVTDRLVEVRLPEDDYAVVRLRDGQPEEYGEPKGDDALQARHPDRAFDEKQPKLFDAIHVHSPKFRSHRPFSGAYGPCGSD